MYLDIGFKHKLGSFKIGLPSENGKLGSETCWSVEELDGRFFKSPSEVNNEFKKYMFKIHVLVLKTLLKLRKQLYVLT